MLIDLCLHVNVACNPDLVLPSFMQIMYHMQKRQRVDDPIQAHSQPIPGQADDTTEQFVDTGREVCVQSRSVCVSVEIISLAEVAPCSAQDP